MESCEAASSVARQVTQIRVELRQVTQIRVELRQSTMNYVRQVHYMYVQAVHYSVQAVHYEAVPIVVSSN